MSDDALKQAKEQVFRYIKLNLGDGMVDVELDPDHLETALDRTLATYRQRSSGSVQESFIFLDLVADKNEYILPKEVQSVRQVYRRSIGSRSSGGDGGTLFEPFNLAYTNTYLLNTTSMGGIATYYMFAQYQKQVGKMFGSEINFTFVPSSRKLIIHQRPRGDEKVMLWAYHTKTDIELIEDVYAGIWVKDYALANAKMMLGQAREKFGTIAGPQGGTTLNGQQLKAEAQTAIEKLELELRTLVSGAGGEGGYTWVTG